MIERLEFLTLINSDRKEECFYKFLVIFLVQRFCKIRVEKPNSTINTSVSLSPQIFWIKWRKNEIVFFVFVCIIYLFRYTHIILWVNRPLFQLLFWKLQVDLIYLLFVTSLLSPSPLKFYRQDFSFLVPRRYWHSQMDCYLFNRFYE